MYNKIENLFEVGVKSSKYMIIELLTRCLQIGKNLLNLKELELCKR